MSGIAGEQGEWVEDDDSNWRSLARLVDLLVFTALAACFPAAAWLAFSPDSTRESVRACMLLALPVMVVLEAVYVASKGTTPGKALCRLRVAPAGQPLALPSLASSLLRASVIYGTFAGAILLADLGSLTKIIAISLNGLPTVFGKPLLHEWSSATLVYAWRTERSERKRPQRDPLAPRSSRPNQHRVP